MDLLNGSVRKNFFRYLSAAFGSALISSIYGIVDMAVVGKYQGPEGTAALAVVAPVWNIIYSLGLLMGVGGSVLLSIAKGKNDEKEQKEYFTTALIGSVVLSLLCWIVVIFFDSEMLTLFGAEESLLPLAKAYLLPVKYTVPVFLFNQMLAAFLRNDNAPSLAAFGVLAGGLFNVFGDLFCVFTLNMGIFGAGLATAIGACISCLIMCTHFLSKKNTLKISAVSDFVLKTKQIVVTGFSTFFIDVAMGILTMLFNRQIVKYLGTDALSVYGVIVNISTIVQCCAYSVGQAAQPMMSVSFGAGKMKRIDETMKYAVWTCVGFGVIWTALMMICPMQVLGIFMDVDESIAAIAPSILRTYSISFLLLPFNVFSTYYFQAIMKPQISFGVSFFRGLVVSGFFILVLPGVFGGNAVWLSMPLTELILCAGVIVCMIKCRQELMISDHNQEENSYEYHYSQP